MVETLVEASHPAGTGDEPGPGQGTGEPGTGGDGQAEALAYLGQVGRPVHLRVFFTPT